MLTTTTNSTDRSVALEQLSALADGELENGLIGQACLAWQADGELRSSWHAYHLIGDVLRSDDLACEASRDAGFLRLLRARLADEPVVLAPSRAASLPATAAKGAPDGATAGGRRRSWTAASAVAAGFVAVAGVVFVTRAPQTSLRLAAGEPAAAAPVVAAQDLGNVLPTTSATASAADGEVALADPRVSVASGKLIRDVRLDRYLSAHKEFAGSSALGVPSGYLRNATAEAADR